MRLKLLFCSILCFCLLISSIWSEDTEATADEIESNLVLPPEDQQLFFDDSASGVELEEGDQAGVASFLGSFVTLLILVVLIVLAIRFIRNSVKVQTVNDGSLRLLTSKQLRADAYIHVLEVGNEIFLVGTGSTSSMVKIEDQESLDQLRLLATDDVNNKTGFQTFLQKALNGFNLPKEKKSQDLDSTISSSLASFSERMKKLK